MRRLLDKKLYLDTNLFIYALEAFEPHIAVVGAVFEAIDAGRITAVTSLLTLAECLVKPLRDERPDIVDAYASMIQTAPNLCVAEIDRDVLVNASRIRARRPALRMPDAIHLATACRHACDGFLTNDQRITGASTPELPVILLDGVTL